MLKCIGPLLTGCRDLFCPVLTRAGDFEVGEISALEDPCPLPAKDRVKQKQRHLTDKMKRLHAPMCDFGMCPGMGHGSGCGAVDEVMVVGSPYNWGFAASATPSAATIALAPSRQRLMMGTMVNGPKQGRNGNRNVRKWPEARQRPQ